MRLFVIASIARLEVKKVYLTTRLLHIVSSGFSPISTEIHLLSLVSGHHVAVVAPYMDAA